MSSWPRAALLALCLLMLVLEALFFLRTPLWDLAAGWLSDDAFYYLQPAWLRRDHAGFSFDGLHGTYGFQPLWMLVLSELVAPLAPDRASFLRMALLLGGILHVAVAPLLWFRLRAALGEPLALVAPLIWLLNPSLIHLCASGKETGLYALLATLLLGFGAPALLGPDRARLPWVQAGVGLLCGLLVLCRVNALLVVGLFAIQLLLPTSKTSRSERVKRLLPVLGVGLLVTLPWFAWAEWNLGALLPSSGSRKLIGAWTRLASPSLETFPPLKDLFRYLLQAPHWALGFYLPGPELLDLGKIGVRQLLLVGTSIGLPLLAIRGLRGRVLSSGEALLSDSGLLLGLAWGLANTVINGLLLPEYVLYAYWYRVPEVLLLVVLSSLLVATALSSLEGPPRALALTLIGAVAAMNLRATVLFATGTWSANASTFSYAALRTAEWLSANLPPGARVGSWNAGALGFFAEGPIIVNLDGLANTPAFIQEVVEPDLRFQAGSSADNAMARYLEGEEIQYLADAVVQEELGQKPFGGVVAPELYEVLFVDQEPLLWGEPGRERRLVVVALRGR